MAPPSSRTPPRGATGLLAQQAVGAALARHDTLASLLQRVADSRARLAAVQAVLPPGLRGSVEAGPLDETEWILLVKQAGAAAKLRQCVPQIEAACVAAGHAPRKLRVKLSMPG